MITGKTKVVGVIGWPVAHSLSPPMQNAAFAAAGLDYVYVALPVAPEALAAAVAGFKAAGLAGINITVPHKVAIIPLLDALDRSAEQVGAVNTVVFAGGRAVGHNTDVAGFVASLAADGVSLRGSRVAVLGAGGVARAVAWGCLDNGAASVTVGARDAAKAAAFAASFPTGAVTGAAWHGDEFTAALGGCDIVVNCTPLGMHPQVGEEPPLAWEALSRRAVVCDLIYTPPETAFMHRASQRGHRALGGAGMLVEQGAAAFTLWTGHTAPRAEMHAALATALGWPPAHQ